MRLNSSLSALIMFITTFCWALRALLILSIPDRATESDLQGQYAVAGSPPLVPSFLSSSDQLDAVHKYQEEFVWLPMEVPSFLFLE